MFLALAGALQPVALLLDEGAGLALVAAYVPWWRDDAYYGVGRWQGTAALDGGGALVNQSIHGVDALQWIVAATMPGLAPGENPVESVVAFSAVRAHDPARLEVEDSCVAILRFRDGTLGQILATTAMFPGQLRRILVGGRDGTAEVLEEQLTDWRFRAPSPDDDATRGRKRDRQTEGDTQTGEAPGPPSAPHPLTS